MIARASLRSTESVMNDKDEKPKRLEKRSVCPSFSGEEKEYEDWRVKVEDWMMVVGENVKYPGLEIRMALEGKAGQVTRDLEREKIAGEGGEKIVLAKLDSVYREDKTISTYYKVRNYLKIERKEGEKMRDFIVRYEKVSGECQAATGAILQGEIRGCHVLDQAGLTEEQKQLVLSACGNEQLTYERVGAALQRIFGSLTLKNDEEDWFGYAKGSGFNDYRKRESRGRGYRGRGYGNRSRGAGIGAVKNPIGKYGTVTKCAICNSEYHWAKECPQNIHNKKEQKEALVEERRKEEHQKEEKMYAGNILKKLMHSEEEGECLIDTGCRSTVIGEE